MAADGMLKREVGLPGAVMLGLGSILGTGIFVSIGLAAGLAGPALPLAVGLAAIVAICNGLSSAQLAAAHPVSGGTYAYGYKYLHPRLGFAAGWLYMCAKSASAATAALGFAGYLLSLLGREGEIPAVPIALALVAVLTGLVLSGLKRSAVANTIIVSGTLGALALFVFGGAGQAVAGFAENISGPLTTARPSAAGLFEATALSFVAYTGYGRVATLGEEVKDPAWTIPRAVIATLAVSMTLYLAVATVAVGSVGAARYAELAGSQAAPLALVARDFGPGWLPPLVAVGAVTAMAGVLLNLILGLSRILLAMGRKNDVPRVFAQLDAKQSPRAAVIAVGIIIAGLVSIGSVKTTWSFSAFTVLGYYALANLSAFCQPKQERRYGRVISGVGLAACLSLAVFIEPTVMAVGTGLLLLGFVWREVWKRVSAPAPGR